MKPNVLKNNGDKMAIVGVENWGNPPLKQIWGPQKSLLECKRDCI